jgi:putative Mn2+ efflux pump MntP
MPVLGWYLGSSFSVYISAWDHWIAFVLLAFIGGKMLIEALCKKTADENKNESKNESENRNENRDEKNYPAKSDITNIKTLLVLSLATSIDALAVGISFSILGQGIWINSSIIGGITFAICLTGFGFGQRLRHRMGFLLEKWAEAAGGIILIGLGVKILVEHLITQH